MFFQLVPLRNYTITVYCGNAGGFERTGSSVTFTANIPVPVMTVGTVTGATVVLSWGSDSYATWHRVEYTQIGNRKKTSSVTVVAAMQTGSGITVSGLSPGFEYDFRVFSGMGASYYEPHGTSFVIKTPASMGILSFLLILSFLFFLILF